MFFGKKKDNELDRRLGLLEDKINLIGKQIESIDDRLLAVEEELVNKDWVMYGVLDKLDMLDKPHFVVQDELINKHKEEEK